MRLDKVPVTPGRSEVEHRLQRAIARFEAEDQWLLEIDASERAVSHRLAVCLQGEFNDWHVDCEYNRIGAAIKSLDPPDDPIDWEDTEAKTVFPDIIVHKRGEQGPNLLVIEMKKSTGKRADFDRDKLRAFTGPDLRYAFGVFIQFTPGQSGYFDIIEWFEGHSN